ncbi:MAG: PorT family protein, partial [Hymenobacter sp.]
MKTMTHLPLLAGSLLLTATAHAQTTFSVGPRVGLNVATAHFPDKSSYRLAGFEAGLTGNLQLGHFAVQPSLLFSQKGYRTHGNLFTIDAPGTYEETVRLNYLMLPVNLAYTLGENGQGLQVFAGPYVGLFLGGTYTRRIHEDGYLGGPAYDAEYGGKVKAANAYTSGGDRYSQR